MFVRCQCMLEIHNFLFDLIIPYSWEFVVGLWETLEFVIFQKSVLELLKLCGLLKLPWMCFAVWDDQAESCLWQNYDMLPTGLFCFQGWCCSRRLWNLLGVVPLMVGLEGYICLWSQSSSLCFLIGYDIWASASCCYCYKGLKYLKLWGANQPFLFISSVIATRTN